MANEPARLALCRSVQTNPFSLAIAKERGELIEMFQWKLSFDEIVSAFALREVDCYDRYRPVMEGQCESLSAWLNRDVVDIVFEYLGFNRELRVGVASSTDRSLQKTNL